MIRPATPAIIKITPITCRSTWAGFQVTPNQRIAPITTSAMLPPIVTGLATSPGRTFPCPHPSAETPGTPRPARVKRQLPQPDRAGSARPRLATAHSLKTGMMRAL